MADVEYLDWASLVLVIVGALNWGLVGLGQVANMRSLNLVQMTVGQISPTLASVVYLLVGLAGLYQIYFGYELYEEQ
ncbi:MAG: DUF378 domain-containing protein [Candidatus Nanohaloarchaea archaeon]